jgi:hypothetical protein
MLQALSMRADAERRANRDLLTLLTLVIDVLFIPSPSFYPLRLPKRWRLLSTRGIGGLQRGFKINL